MFRLPTWAKHVGREMSGAAAKELFKWLVLGIGAVFGTAILAVLGDIFQLDASAKSWGAVWQKISGSALLLWQTPKAFTLGSLADDWIRTGFIFAVVSSYLILFIVVRRGRAKLRAAQTPVFLSRQAGLGGRWPHAMPNAPGGAPWSDLCADIDRPDNVILYILGANGIATFGRPGSPLYDSMQKFNGNTLVILCDPESEETAGRARVVSVAAADYKRNIEISERRIRELKRKRHSIDGRFYDSQPNWKMIITDRTAWIQYYVPNGKHVADTPLWRFDITKNGDGLFHLFLLEFTRIWLSCKSSPMNL